MNQYAALLKLESVNKTYSAEAGLKINVLEDISLEIQASDTGTITSILAPFESGKSTLLKIISGITDYASGRIYINDSETKKRIPIITEKPSSFPWFNVAQNIQLVFEFSENNKYTLAELISMVGLKGYEDHFPNNKSFGFRFRISLARALALNPEFILIDDSFRVMRKESREEIYVLLKELSLKKKKNFILATTNVVEAIQLSDKIFLMSKKPGKIIRMIETQRDESSYFENRKSEKFTLYKTEIEQTFESVGALTKINFSV